MLDNSFATGCAMNGPGKRPSWRRCYFREIKSMVDNSSESSLIELTADIVSAYVSNNPVPSADIPALIGQIHSALKRVSGGQAAAPAEPLKPAVPVKRSISADSLVCLEDALKFKSLTRHLRPRYNMTPDQYREKW